MSETEESGPGVPGPSREQRPERHAVRARALVAGLAPSVVPMIIREWSPGGMRLAFDGQAGTVDDRWATAGAGVLVIFKATIDDRARRVTLHGRLRSRNAIGIEAQLLALDDDALAALRSLIAGERPTAPLVSKPSENAPAMTADAIAALCLASIKQQVPRVALAYLDGLAESLRRLQASGKSAPEQKRYTLLLTEFERARTHLEQTILAEALPGVAAYLSDEQTAGGGTHTTGLSLLESIDLRATLLVTEAVENVAARLGTVWRELDRRLYQLVPDRNDANALAPVVFCHHFRDAIFFDQQVGALRQIDLAAGFSDEFVGRLEKMYRELLDLLDRHDIRAAGGTSPSRGRDSAANPGGKGRGN